MSDLLSSTCGRGYGLLLLVISLPFITPIPLPGLSTPFGLVVLVVGTRLALGRRPWLPKRLLQHRLPPQFFGRMLAAAAAVVRSLEHVTRPRLDFLHDGYVYQRIAGGLIAVAGLLLLLPIPIPFTNSAPALTVVLLSAGSIERDGLFLILGLLAFLLALGYFALLGIGGVEIFDRLMELGS
ncbi:MAG TPA: exopolysaccharide biosynthesis protein [Opitutaceae bacterium]|nr:exopolysaccharide biosynthesis protein [Opitutaceae bacterium]